MIIFILRSFPPLLQKSQNSLTKTTHKNYKLGNQIRFKRKSIKAFFMVNILQWSYNTTSKVYTHKRLERVTTGKICLFKANFLYKRGNCLTKCLFSCWVVVVSWLSFDIVLLNTLCVLDMSTKGLHLNADLFFFVKIFCVVEQSVLTSKISTSFIRPKWS